MKNSNPKILLIISGLGKGGAEKIVYDLIKSIKNQFEVTLVNVHCKNELLEQYGELGIEIHQFDLKGSNTLAKWTNVLIRIKDFILKNKFDLIHAHMFPSLFFALITKTFSWKSQIIFTLHSSFVDSKLRKICLFLSRPIRTVDVIFHKDDVRIYTKRKYQVIPNGIDFAKLDGGDFTKNKRFTIITLSRLEEVKNHKLMILIANELRNEVDFELQIYGDGSLRTYLVDLIDKLKLNHNVKIFPFTNDIKFVCSKAHMFWLTSKREGLPLSVLEAAACELPVLVPPIGTLPGIINSNNGYIVDYNQMHPTLKSIIMNYEEAVEKAIRLKELVKRNYNLEQYAAEHIKLYSEVLSRTDS